MKPVLLMILAATVYSCGSGNKKDEKQEVVPQAKKAAADPSMLNIAASKDIATLLCQHWEHKGDHELPYLNEDDEDEVPMRAFYMFNDGSVAKDPRNKLLTGKWSLDEATKELQVDLDNGVKERYMIMTISAKRLTMSRNGEEPEEYRADGLMHKDNKNDPFYLPNIQWMIKPGAAEDDAAIHRRVKACLHFYYLFYMDTYKRRAKEIFFYGLPGCFKWYAGGIYLKKEMKLNKKWKDIFFNAADAHKAYELLDKIISQPYNWDKSDSGWIKQNAGVLKQMEARTDSL